MRIIAGRTLTLTFAIVILSVSTDVHPAQIIPTGVEYANDTIELGAIPLS
jgi:hypothetical protein